MAAPVRDGRHNVARNGSRIGKFHFVGVRFRARSVPRGLVETLINRRMLMLVAPAQQSNTSDRVGESGSTFRGVLALALRLSGGAFGPQEQSTGTPKR